MLPTIRICFRLNVCVYGVTSLGSKSWNCNCQTRYLGCNNLANNQLLYYSGKLRQWFHVRRWHKWFSGVYLLRYTTWYIRGANRSLQTFYEMGKHTRISSRIETKIYRSHWKRKSYQRRQKPWPQKMINLKLFSQLNQL